jgi:endonuclease/exonuclease/phosphatase family metal-dependent hydrolase
MPTLCRSRTASLLVVLGLLLVGATGCQSGADGNGTARAPDAPQTHPHRILVDGAVGDWEPLDPIYRDPRGDVADTLAAPLDLGPIWGAHDDRFFFLRVTLNRTINLQEGNRLTLYLDTDNDAQTGIAAHGLGADVQWTFGEREGRIAEGGTVDSVGHAALGLVTAPTIRDSTFEIALDRQATHDGTPLFDGDVVRVAVAAAGGDDLPNGADVLPNAGALTYRFTPGAVADVDVPPLGRTDRSALRVLSYNVEFDGLFDTASQAPFTRILRTVTPDLIGFQEIYDHTAAETAEVVETMLPTETGRRWHTAKAGRDLVAVSRYPIRETFAIPGADDYDSGAFVINTDDVLGRPLLFIVMHPPCCNGGTPPRDTLRQDVVDSVVAFLRDAKTDGGRLTVPDRTPIVIAGDMNFVGASRQPQTLRTGQIADAATHGAPIRPDWDASPLVDAAPPTTGVPMNFTWYSPSSSFPPGRLDYIFYTDSVLESLREYTLFTPALSDSALTAYGLEAQDVVNAADHLPVVADFALRED